MDYVSEDITMGYCSKCDDSFQVIIGETTCPSGHEMEMDDESGPGPKEVMINVAKNDIKGGIRITGLKHFKEVVTNNHVTFNVDEMTQFQRIEDCFWQSLAFCKSFRVTSENLGVSFMVVTKK